MNFFKLTSLLFIIFFIAFPIKGASKKETITFIHTDHLGSPIMATDESGKVKWRKDYQPFGKALTNKDTDNNVGLTGHKDDKSLGLTYMQARWYQPDTGRFMALDPLRYRDVHSFNRYVYGNNNPYKYVDPDGENPLIVFGIMFLLDMVSPADESCNGCLTPVGSPLPPTAKASNLAKKFDDIKIETKLSKKLTTQFENKIEKQMSKRGWDKDSVNSTVDNPNRTVSTRDTRWNSDGTRRDDPATAYIREDGHYVVRNNNDGTIVQISNRNQANWKSPFE